MEEINFCIRPFVQMMSIFILPIFVHILDPAFIAFHTASKTERLVPRVHCLSLFSILLFSAHPAFPLLTLLSSPSSPSSPSSHPSPSSPPSPPSPSSPPSSLSSPLSPSSSLFSPSLPPLSLLFPLFFLPSFFFQSVTFTLRDNGTTLLKSGTQWLRSLN